MKTQWSKRTGNGAFPVKTPYVLLLSVTA